MFWLIFRIQTGWWKYFFLLPWAYYSSPYQLAGFLCLFQIWSKYIFADSVINFVPKYLLIYMLLILRCPASNFMLLFRVSTGSLGFLGIALVSIGFLRVLQSSLAVSQGGFLLASWGFLDKVWFSLLDIIRLNIIFWSLVLFKCILIFVFPQ